MVSDWSGDLPFRGDVSVSYVGFYGGVCVSYVGSLCWVHPPYTFRFLRMRHMSCTAWVVNFLSCGS